MHNIDQSKSDNSKYELSNFAQCLELLKLQKESRNRHLNIFGPYLDQYNLLQNNLHNQHKRLSAVVGNPIINSKSPDIHEFLYQKRKINAEYLKLKLDHIEQIKQLSQLFDIAQLSITTPFKEKVVSLLDSVSPDVTKCNAANTVIFKNNKMHGENTDLYGFEKMFETHKIELKDKTVLILGAGGVVRTLIYYLTKKQADIKVYSRNYQKAQKLNIKNKIQIYNKHELNKNNYQIIINATPVGAKHCTDKLPILENNIKKAEVVFDLVYEPENTELIKLAQKNHKQTMSGLKMLVWQGIKQFELWTGEAVSIKEINQLYQLIKQKKDHQFLDKSFFIRS